MSLKISSMVFVTLRSVQILSTFAQFWTTPSPTPCNHDTQDLFLTGPVETARQQRTTFFFFFFFFFSSRAQCKRCYLGEWNLTLTTFFIFESRSKNKSCLFMSTMHRNEWPKIHRSQERPPRLLEGHSGDSCKVPLLMHIETWNSVYGFSNVYL